MQTFSYPAGHAWLRAEIGGSETDDVLVLTGELDLAVIDGLEAFAMGAVKGGLHRRFVVDVEQLSFCGSLGLSLFLRLDTAAKARGHEFLLRHPDNMLMRLLGLTQLDEKLTVEP